MMPEDSSTADDPSEDPKIELPARVAEIYSQFGQRKSMGASSPSASRPHFFLLRTFAGENDLLVILNTKRCRYQCHFCTLPAKSSRRFISDRDVALQFLYVAEECRHALSLLDRVTIGNEGSILDENTLGASALDQIMDAIGQIRRVRRVEIETRLEFVRPTRVRELADRVPRARIGILTGFETVSESIRDDVLGKRETLATFRAGLDRVNEAGALLTTYVLYKPDPTMTDAAAYAGARTSIEFLAEECGTRNIPLTVRLNPMYRSRGSRWADQADLISDYQPPRLTDAMRLAQAMASRGVEVYLGLSDEGLADQAGTYMAREDYTPRLIKQIKLFNDRKTLEFPALAR